MALFDNRSAREADELSGSDAATRALSVTVVENDFVEAVYAKIAVGLRFHLRTDPPSRAASRRSSGWPSSRATGSSRSASAPASTSPLYPKEATVTGIDFSAEMLEKARERMERKGVRNARLLQMDATDLKFDDGSFDIVYAPYVISVVPDPVKVAREMYRVCRPGGRVIILNHFLSANPLVSRVERWMSPATIHIGFKSDLDLPAFLAQSELHPKSIEKVNVPRIWSLITDRQGRR